MQNCSPALLSTSLYRDYHFLVEEIQPTKDKINFKLVKNNYRDMCRVIIDMATLTAFPPSCEVLEGWGHHWFGQDFMERKRQKLAFRCPQLRGQVFPCFQR